MGAARRQRLDSVESQSAELAAYRWNEARASSLMRGISESVEEECEVMAGFPSWPGVIGPVELAG